MRLSGRRASRFTRAWSPPQQVAVFSVLIVQVAAFVTQLILTNSDGALVAEYLALSQRGVSQAYAWQFFTALLLHINVWHFAANILVLYFAGRDVESIIGQKQFIFVYLFGAFAGELGHLFVMPEDCVLFAASGGTAAIAAAYATMLPELEVTTLVLFMIPVRLKIRTLIQIALVVAAALLLFDRSGAVGHSAFLGGAIAGCFYAHLLGFGRTSFIQRLIRARRLRIEKLRSMSAEQFLAQEVDPVLEKIARQGLPSLSRRERKLLAAAREKMLRPTQT